MLYNQTTQLELGISYSLVIFNELTINKVSYYFRCLSAITLATKCMTPAFRMHVKAHGTVAKIFRALQDATKDQVFIVKIIQLNK